MERLSPRAALRLIGAPSLEEGGGPIRLSRRKSLALLAYLALERGPHGRDSLAALFWPDCDQKRSRSNLRSSVFDLAGTLGEEGFLARQDRIELEAGSLRVDVLDFEDLSRPCPGHGQERTCPLCTGRFEAAARIWENPRAGFMDGFTLPDSCDFDDWQFSWREKLHEELCVTLRRLALSSRLSGDLARALLWTGRWLEASPLDSEAWKLQIRSLVEDGKRDRARERYEAWKEASTRELGRPPRDSFDALSGGERRKRVTDLAGAGRAGEARSLRGGLVGRDVELDVLGNLLSGPGSRLVTILGTGGLGKTSLARAFLGEKGSAYPGGAFFVDLSALRDPGLLPIVVAEAIGLKPDCGAGHDVEVRLKSRLSARRTLLVLDNFEQLLEGRTFVERLLAACQCLAILVTSREALGLKGETVLEPPPLKAPPAAADVLPGELSAWPALDLIVRRALTANPAFELSERTLKDCATLCARLDGLPLALELAASRFAALEPGELVERLDRKLDLLVNHEPSAPARHRTLRAVIDWSYDFLSRPEQELLSALGLFPESFDLAAAEAILDGGSGTAGPPLLDSLTSLISKSLLRRQGDSGQTRYFLPEVLREYARARLEGDPRRRDFEMRHALHFLGLARKEAAELRGRGQKRAIQSLGREGHNFRAALACFLEAGQAREALELCSSLSWFWYRAGHYDWGRWALEKALAMDGEADLAAQRGACLRGLGWFRFVQGSWQTALTCYLSALPLLESSGEDRELSYCLSDLGVAKRWLGDTEEGNRRCAEAVAVARKTGDPGVIAHSLIWNYATTGGRLVDPEQEAGLEEAARLSREEGDDWIEAHAFQGLGDYLREGGRYGEARLCFEEALRGFTAAGDELMQGWSLEGSGMNALLSGRAEEAAATLGEALAKFSKLGDYGGCAYLAGELGLAMRAKGEEEAAERLLGTACAMAESLGLADAPERKDCDGLEGRLKHTAWAGKGHLGEALAEAEARGSEAWRLGRTLSLEAALRLATGSASTGAFA